MADQNINEPENSEPKKYPFWPDSLQESNGENLKRSSFLEKVFAAFQKALVAIAKLAGQSFISWMLFLMLAILLVNPKMWGDDQTYLTVEEIVKLTTLTISVFLAVRVFEDSDVQSIGLNRNAKAIRDYLVGFLIPFSFLGLRFILFVSTSVIRVENYTWETNSFSYVLENLAITLCIFIFVGWSEELLSRGYHLRILSKGFNKFLGIIFSAGIFTYLHHDNEGITVSALFFIFLFGVMMCFAFFRTGQLWLAMGIHTGWDFFAAVIFGSTPIYGLKIFHIMDISYSISSIGYFIFDLIGLIFMTILVYLYTRSRKPEPLNWQ